MKMETYRFLQNSNAMVQSSDSFGYRYSITTERENGSGGVSSQLGGWSPSSEGEGSSLEEEGGGGASKMPTWAVVLMFAGCCAVFFIWIAYTAYIACTTPRASHQATQSQPITQKTKLSREERKARLLAYFESSGNQMEVKGANLLKTNTVKGDIEQGPGNNQDRPSTTTIGDFQDDDDENDVILVITNAITAPRQEVNTTSGSVSMDQTKNSDDAAMQDNVDQSSALSSCRIEDHDEEKGPKHLAAAPPSVQLVTDACAICLEPYRLEERVVWSNNKTCPHVFHKDCFVEYLLSHRGKGTPCPSCRQTYCDESIFCLSPHEKKGDEPPSSASDLEDGQQMVGTVFFQNQVTRVIRSA